MKKIFIICFSLFLISCTRPFDYLVVVSENTYKKNTFSYCLMFCYKNSNLCSYQYIELPKGTLKVGDTLFSIDRGVNCESKN